MLNVSASAVRTEGRLYAHGVVAAVDTDAPFKHYSGNTSRFTVLAGYSEGFQSLTSPGRYSRLTIKR